MDFNRSFFAIAAVLLAIDNIDYCCSPMNKGYMIVAYSHNNTVFDFDLCRLNMDLDSTGVGIENIANSFGYSFDIARSFGYRNWRLSFELRNSEHFSIIFSMQSQKELYRLH